jgi:hypothetical protein
MIRGRGTFTFIDMLFNLLIGFTFLFMLAFLLINPVAKKHVHDPKAEYLIISSWDNMSKADIDLWVKDGNGAIVSFRSKDYALMHLDRDDLGTRNDTYEIAPTYDELLKNEEPKIKEIHYINREVLSLRSKKPRTYTATVHFYSNHGSEETPLNPEEISVELIQINPYKTWKIVRVQLSEVGQEKHLFKFEVQEDGTLLFQQSDELIASNKDTLDHYFTNQPPDLDHPGDAP